MNRHAIPLSPPKPINGFPRVADKIASDADKTTTIYRRFDRLSARNLSFQEAEIAELEAQLDKYDDDDRAAAAWDVIESHSDWRKFERYAGEKDQNGNLVHPRQAERMELVMKIKEKLKEYHEALAVHQTLLNSKPPAPTTVKAMRNWFLDNDGGKLDPRPQLWGASVRKYEDQNDLVALRVPADQDRLSEFIMNNFGIFFLTSAPDGRSAYVSERSVAKFVAVLSSILSAVLLFGSITSLYFVKNPYALLGMLGGWTVLFATCVGWLTNAKRDQIFAATAAYAAVLVVFVSGTLGGGGTQGVLGTCNFLIATLVYDSLAEQLGGGDSQYDDIEKLQLIGSKSMPHELLHCMLIKAIDVVLTPATEGQDKLRAYNWKNAQKLPSSARLQNVDTSVYHAITTRIGPSDLFLIKSQTKFSTTEF